ncbi:hypothetical protein WA026_021211 [Henosepilachna vigintioctopunctata]|uniref:H15 domain-containing protein n=1 Tax=Henosepilachna vigintioctopunctata TaxID=420089 RepID=A0AAW1UDP8_9CUCU
MTRVPPVNQYDRFAKRDRTVGRLAIRVSFRIPNSNVRRVSLVISDLILSISLTIVVIFLLPSSEYVRSRDTASASPATKAKKGGTDKKASKHAKPTHPPTSDMVNNAIKGLKERSGSSLQAIKKYIATNYKVDPVKFAPFIKKYLNSAVQSGSLVRTKGKGASGSFKLAASGAPGQSKTKTVKPRKAAGDKKRKSVAAKTATTEKPKVASATKAKKAAAEKTEGSQVSV